MSNKSGSIAERDLLLFLSGKKTAAFNQSLQEIPASDVVGNRAGTGMFAEPRQIIKEEIRSLKSERIGVIMLI